MQTCDMEIISKVGRSSFLGGKFTNKLIQSVCFDGQHYYIGFSWTDNETLSTTLKTKDLSFTEDSVIDIRQHAYKHVNDMEFNPDDGKIYVADGENHIFVMDRDMETRYGYDLQHGVWSIARYPDGDWFVFDGKAAYRYNRNFTKGEVIRTGFPQDGYWQGAVMMDGEPYLILSGRQEKPDHYKGNFLYSLFGESIWFPGDREIEGAVIVGGEMHFVYGQLRFGGATWDMNMGIKTIYTELTLRNVKAGNNTILLDEWVPDGYEMAGAIASVKPGVYWRQLPNFGNNGRAESWILKVGKKRVALHIDQDYDELPVQITAFCVRR